MLKKFPDFLYCDFSEEFINFRLLPHLQASVTVSLPAQERNRSPRRQTNFFLLIKALFYSESVFVQIYSQVYLIGRIWVIWGFICKFIWSGIVLFALVSWQNLSWCVHFFPGKFLYKLTQKQEPESTHTLSIPDTDWACRHHLQSHNICPTPLFSAPVHRKGTE